MPSPSVDHAVECFRRRAGASVRTLLAGRAAPVVDVDDGRGDPGLFGPDSVTWRVHADISLLIGGLRALLLQTMHPLAMAGVADHSDYRHDPLGRLHRTAAFVAMTTYGSTTTAESAIEAVARIHERVVGTAPDGRAYSARDAELVTWVHATEVDSFLRIHRRYGRSPLEAAEADRYVGEMAEVARRLGGGDVPTNVAELRERLIGFRPDLHVGRQARDAVRFLVVPPLPLPARAPYAIVAAAASASLPGFARRALRLPLPPLAEPVLIRPAATALLAGLGWALEENRNAEAGRVRAGAG
jgi:uncharacterized protein (DUF2236 family)